MTWLRLDADMPWNDKVIGLPNDTARFAFVKVLCASKVRGKSKFSPASLKEVLGSHARAIPSLLAAGLIDEENGQLVVHDFDDYQRKASHAEAQQRYRSKVTGESPDDHPSITEKSPTGQDSTGRDKTTPPTPPRGTFMGMRPKRVTASVDDVRRQEEESWSKCADCGVVGRKHPASAEHPFRPGLRVAQ